LRVKKLSENATIPVRGSSHAGNRLSILLQLCIDILAGYDLFSAIDVVIAPHGKELVKTDISIAIPSGMSHFLVHYRLAYFAGYYGRVAPRSSLAWKNHIDVGAGVIDEDYRGPLGVVLFNHGDQPFQGFGFCLDLFLVVWVVLLVLELNF
jgi:dUTP pyrophosphatase